MNDQQCEEMSRQLKSLNKNLMGVGCLLVGLLLTMLALLFIVWKTSNLKW